MRKDPQQMKWPEKKLSLWIAAAALVVVFGLALAAAAPAFSRSSILALTEPTSTPTPPPGPVIPLRSIAGLTSLNAEVKIGVNGLINGQQKQGELYGVVATNNQGQSQITVTGDLLGTIAAQVGGSLVGLFTPSSVDIYRVPQGTYIVANSLFPICVKPADPKATEALDEMNPISLISMLTTSDVARGKLIGQETLNGETVNHYVINGAAFLAAAKKSSNPKLKDFGDALWSAEDADLYVDAAGGYPVALRGSYSGAYEPLKFEGDFTVQVELTGVNTNPTFKLPNSCSKPITP